MRWMIATGFICCLSLILSGCADKQSNEADAMLRKEFQAAAKKSEDENKTLQQQILKLETELADAKAANDKLLKRAEERQKQLADVTSLVAGETEALAGVMQKLEDASRLLAVTASADGQPAAEQVPVVAKSERQESNSVTETQGKKTTVLKPKSSENFVPLGPEIPENLRN
jgi:uncharacterized protein